MENYQIIVVAISMFIPISLILSTLHHIKVEKRKIIKQKFEILSLTFFFLFHIFIICIALFLLIISFKILISINNQSYKLDVFKIFIGIIALFFSYGFLLFGINFFKHFYFEASRNVYFDRETEKIIVIKDNIEISINLNSPNLKIIKYSTNFGRMPSSGKTEFYDDQIKIVLSDLLDISPELDEKINNNKNKTIIYKNLNWI